jgi:hypothetical protein
LHKELAKQLKPKKLIALQRSLVRKATKVQLKPKMHSTGEFKEASSLGLSDKFPFGKHKDRTLRFIVRTDPMWLVWIMDNMGTQVEDTVEGAQVKQEEYGGEGIDFADTF